MDFTKFALLLQMIPAILSTILAVEKIVTGPGAGPKKLDVVVGAIGGAAAAVPEIAQNFNTGDLNKAVQNITNAAVSGLNAAGVLKKGTPTL